MAQHQRTGHQSGVVVGIAATVVGITLLHYLTNASFLDYHALYRSLYFLPIIVAALMLGVRGGLLTSLAITLLYSPYVLLFQERIPGRMVDSLLQVVLFNGVAAVTGMLADGQRRRQNEAESLSTYINDVLTSLPVGVATIQGVTGERVARNPVAEQLLASITEPQRLPVNEGYYEVQADARPIGVHCSPLHALDGSAVGHVFVLEDLRERQRVADQALRAERLAALGQLAGGLAHEVRNPLSIVRATGQLLTARLADRQELATYIQVLTTETDRIERLIGELLAYANPRSPVMTSFAPAALVEELVMACEPYALGRDVQVAIAVAPGLPAVQADREQIRQALLNLVLNAVQASTAGQTVTVTCDLRGAQICFAVRDHGPGISTAIRPRIFDPFVTTRDDGNGMGLAMVARIVADHHGAVELEDMPEGGIKARLCVPMGKGEAHE